MRKFTSDELQQVLHDHARWLKSRGKSGKRADLSNADLRNADLSRADLSGASLPWADLRNTDLSNASLRGASGLFAPMAAPVMGRLSDGKSAVTI